MGKLVELLYGEPDVVLEILDHAECDESELRAAISNAFRRIKYLEAATKPRPDVLSQALNEGQGVYRP